MPQPVLCWKMPRVEASSLQGRSAGASVCTSNAHRLGERWFVCQKSAERHKRGVL